MAARGHGIGTMVPDIAARLQEDGATGVTEGGNRGGDRGGDRGDRGGHGGQQAGGGGPQQGGGGRPPQAGGPGGNRNRSNSRRARLTSAARTGISHRRFKGQQGFERNH